MSGKQEKTRGAEVRASRARSRVEARKRSKAAAAKAKRETGLIRAPSRKRSRGESKADEAAAGIPPLPAENKKKRRSPGKRCDAESAVHQAEPVKAVRTSGMRPEGKPGRKEAGKYKAGRAARNGLSAAEMPGRGGDAQPLAQDAGEGEGRSAAQAPHRKKRLPSPLRTVVLGVLLVLSLAALLWIYTATGVLNVKDVEVEGNETLDAGYLRSLSGITTDTHLLKMDVKAVEKALLSEPYIAKVEVSRHFPHTVVLEVTERRPSGAILQNGKYCLVDQEGMILESSDAMPAGLVEIKDLELPLLLPGTEVRGADFASVTSLLGSLPAALREKAAAVGLRADKGLYLEAGGTVVIYGEAEDLSRKNSIALLALGSLVGRYGAVEYIDVSFPDHPVIKPFSAG